MSSTSRPSDTKYVSQELLKDAQNGNKDAMEELVKRNTPLVYSLVKRYAYHKKESVDDLMQIGTLGLIKAIKNFDLNYGTQFSTYAVHVISGELKRHFRDDSIIKVSRSVKNVYMKAREVRDRLINETGEEPSINKISAETGETKENIMYAFEACRAPEYLDDYINYEGNDSRRKDTIIEDLSNNLDDSIDLLDLKNAIGVLPADYRQIVVLRYFNDMTQSQVAKIMGISQVQVSRLEKKIIANIKKQFIEEYNA